MLSAIAQLFCIYKLYRIVSFLENRGGTPRAKKIYRRVGVGVVVGGEKKKKTSRRLYNIGRLHFEKKKKKRFKTERARDFFGVASPFTKRKTVLSYILGSS